MLAASVAIVLFVSGETAVAASPRSPFFVATLNSLVSSSGRSYSVVGALDASHGSFAPDRPLFVVAQLRTSKQIEVLTLGGSRRVITTVKPMTAPPVIAPGDEVAYASGNAVHYSDGRTIRARGLPSGARIVKLEMSSRSQQFAATVSWGGGVRTEGDEAIYVVTNGEARLVAGSFHEFCNQPDPIWSPNGKRIAFERQVNCVDGVIFSVRSDGTGLVRVSRTVKAFGLSWSPDSTEIAYTARYGWHPHKSNGVPEVYVADLHGDERRLTNTPSTPGPTNGVGDYISPGSVAGAWSPDGHWIAVITGGVLGIVPANGGPETILARFGSTTSSFSRGPVWWPRPSAPSK